MRPASLVLSYKDDLNLLTGAWGLSENGVHVISGESFADTALGQISVHMENSSSSTPAIFEGFDVRSVWCHRPRPPKTNSALSREDVEFVETEWLMFQRNLFALSRHAIPGLWVNNYTCATEAENKLVQLRAAQQLGIKYPPTLFSNDPSKVRVFAKKYGKIVYKHFFPSAWRDAQTGRYFCSEVAILEDISSIDDAVIALCPGIYQPYIEKTCDIRVTVIGDRFFPVRIRAQRGSAFVDWRPHATADDLDAAPCILPSAYEEKLSQLMRKLGIVYGCIDLVLDSNDELHFLEVNQSGQYIFVEQWLPDLPLLKSMCAMLSQGRTDYSLDSAADISFAKFRKLDIYHQWRERQRIATETALASASQGFEQTTTAPKQAAG